MKRQRLKLAVSFYMWSLSSQE